MNRDTTTDILQARLAALLAERDQFIISANLKLGEYNGRLAELERLLKLNPTASSSEGLPMAPIADRGQPAS